MRLYCSCSPIKRLALEEAAILQVVFDDDISDGVKDELHVLGVGGTGEVRVNLFGVLPLIQVLKLTLDVSSRLLICAGSLQRFLTVKRANHTSLYTHAHAYSLKIFITFYTLIFSLKLCTIKKKQPIQTLLKHAMDMYLSL